MANQLSHHLLTMAYNNAWANHRLYKACLQLSQDDFVEPRCSFFPSIKATLNHILIVDWLYLQALECEQAGEAPEPFVDPEEQFEDCEQLQREQAQADHRLIAYCSRLQDDNLDRLVGIVRPDRLQREPRLRLLSHVFEHQIHHRGQVHSMLCETEVKPPQLDEFFCIMDTDARAQDFEELGWTEAQIWSRT